MDGRDWTLGGGGRGGGDFFTRQSAQKSAGRGSPGSMKSDWYWAINSCITSLLESISRNPSTPEVSSYLNTLGPKTMARA